MWVAPVGGGVMSRGGAEEGVEVCMEVAVAAPASRACARISEQVAGNGQEDRAEMRETDKSKRSN